MTTAQLIHLVDSEHLLNLFVDLIYKLIFANYV